MAKVTMNSRLLMKYDTTANWNTIGTTFQPMAGEIIVYSDYYTRKVNGVDKTFPGFKIGDGNAYLIDLPFATGQDEIDLLAHVDNTAIHVTDAKKSFWDNKLNCAVNEQTETLIFNRS